LAKIARHPDLVVWWNPAGPVVRNLESGLTLSGDAATIAVLTFFDRPRDSGEAAESMPYLGAAKVKGRVRLLRRLGFLIPETTARRKRSRVASWRENVASALHQSASRDLRYLWKSTAAVSLARQRASGHRPPLYKRYRTATRVAIPSAPSARADLEITLSERRTIRKFRRLAVSLVDVGAVLRGTFGRTGWHDGGFFGSLLTKTSPSAGSLHPIECYVVAWNVRDLDPGLYHFDVGAGDLRRLRRGRFQTEAVNAASGQAWVGNASFLCVMTAVFQRSLWKYQDEVTYRTLFLDAGHLAQTFCLLATARGLGPFTTAAIQDSFIEKLLRLDGTTEFPVYICGAGLPERQPD
jgi:SagB-type dehydrogenase family enzyme